MEYPRRNANMGTRVLLLCATVALSVASADTLVLHDGRTIQGQYLGGTARQVRMAVGDNVQTFDVTDISSLQFEGAKSTTAAAPVQPAPAPTAAEPAVSASETTKPSKILRVEPSAPAPAVTASASEAATSEIPTGAAITVRMIDAVDSKDSRPGQTFKASVDDPVLVGERIVIPRGADVVTRLVEVKDPNKLSGGGQLTLGLDSIAINGRPVNVTSGSVTTTGESRTGDSAKVIGGTAALGAIIGAIAGGGKGAAIGAASGAGAGTAVRVLTKGSEVKIPSETRLTFTLQSPVKL
jgi:hypothetical protein